MAGEYGRPLPTWDEVRAAIYELVADGCEEPDEVDAALVERFGRVPMRLFILRSYLEERKRDEQALLEEHR